MESLVFVALRLVAPAMLRRMCKPHFAILSALLLGAAAAAVFWALPGGKDCSAAAYPAAAQKAVASAAATGARDRATGAAAREVDPQRAARAARIAAARTAKDFAGLHQLAEALEAEGVPGDVQQAAALFLEAARGGYALSMLRAGDFAARGLGGGEPRADEALRWYQQAAEAGVADGYARIARMYFEGVAVPVDFAAARTYIDQGIAAGSVDALFLKSVTLLGNRGTETQALQLLADAAARGSADAQALIARLYAQGDRMPKDAAEAMAWARAAAANGSALAAVDLAKLLLVNGDRNGEAAAAAEAAELLLTADAKRSARAAWELVGLQIVARANGGALADGRTSFQQAYDQGSTAAAFGLALSARGQGQDAVLAWLDKGADRQDWRSTYARALYQKGAELGTALDTAARATMEEYLAYQVKEETPTTGLVMPVPLQTPRPELPAELSVLNFQGSAMAEFVVGEDGRPKAISVLGATHPQLEGAVRAAVAMWRFKPASRNGAYYPQPMRVPFRFQSGK